MKRILIYVCAVLVVFLVALASCDVNSNDNEGTINSPVASKAAPKNNMKLPVTYSGEGKNARASVTIDKNQETVKYEFTNNTKERIDIYMNYFFSFSEPLDDVFPLCIRIYDDQNNIVRFYIMVDDKDYDNVMVTQSSDDEGAVTTHSPNPPGSIYSVIEKKQIITVVGKLLDAAQIVGKDDIVDLVFERSAEQIEPISTLATGRYTVEVFLFNYDHKEITPDKVSVAIEDLYDSTVKFEMDIP